MQGSTPVGLRPAGVPVPASPTRFRVRVVSITLMSELVKVLLERFCSCGEVEVLVCRAEALGPGDVVVEQVDTGRKMVIFGSLPAHETVAHHLASGAFSLLSVDASAEELRAAVESLTSGPPVVATGIVKALASIPQVSREGDTRITTRERDVLSLLQDGLSNGEIAERLSVSPNTVRSHLQSLSSKLGVTSRSKLAARARALRIS